MKGSKIWRGILISVSHFLICVLSGALGWPVQTMVVSTASILAIYLAYTRIHTNWGICMAIVAPFYMVYSTLSLYIGSNATYVIWIMGIINTVLTYFLLRRRVRLWKASLWMLFMVFFAGIIVWPNVFAFIHMEAAPGRYKVDGSRIVDVNENPVSLADLKGKVVLFDVWSSSCYYCIKQFPKIQELYNEYKSDTSVRIITLNLPLKKDNGERPKRFLDKYSFEKLFFKSEEDYKNLPIDGVPLTLIMDKNLRCRYAGKLNTEWNIIINNTRAFIEMLKKEKTETDEIE